MCAAYWPLHRVWSFPSRKSQLPRSLCLKCA
jgi:hypothetical protein